MPTELVKGAQSINEAVALVHGVDAACGPAAAYEAAGSIGGFELSTEGLQALVTEGLQTGHLTTGGQDVENVLWDLEQYGIGGSIWNAPSESSLAQTLDRNLADDKPTVMGLAEAHYLTDEPASLHGHYVTIVGKLADGNYATADPNTSAASSGDFTSNSAHQLFLAQGLGNITPDKQASGSFVPPGVHELVDTSTGVGFPTHFTIGFDPVPFQNTVIRMGIGLLGIVIIAVSFNNLLGGLGLPDVQSVIKKEVQTAAKITDVALKVGA